MAINYKQCLNCGSKNSLKIIYGEPSFELYQEVDAGKVKLGGCCIWWVARNISVKTASMNGTGTGY